MASINFDRRYIILHVFSFSGQCSSYAYFRGHCALPVLACALPDLHAPCPNLKKKIFFIFLQNVIPFFVFSDSRCKNACKMLADLCPYFHQSPTRPNIGRPRVKVCPILCRLRTKLCPNFGHSHAGLCPISFAPCPFPNLAGTRWWLAY